MLFRSAEVSGGGKKPWRQKGSGRARVGSIRSPLWRGGGKIFAYNSDINRHKKINKNFYRFCIRILLSQLFREKRIFIFEHFNLDSIGTKLFLDKIARLEADLQKAEDEINLEQAKNGPKEYKKFHLIALNRIELEITITKQ